VPVQAWVVKPVLATAYRDGDVLRLLNIPPDHDTTHRKKYANWNATAPLAIIGSSAIQAA
jgi:hypothetical protein